METKIEIIPALVKEFENENRTTRAMLSRIPDTIYDWQPHPKSMTVSRLASHLADLASWPQMVLGSEGLDFAANPYNPPVPNNTADLLKAYDKSYETGLSALKSATDADLIKTWTLSNGGHVLAANNKLETLRMVYCQIVHHRAQMGVFLRLNDIPLPPSYGPSADEGSL